MIFICKENIVIYIELLLLLPLSMKTANGLLLTQTSPSFLSFRATMATAPYNYSYIFKYIIIGKWAMTTQVLSHVDELVGTVHIAFIYPTSNRRSTWINVLYTVCFPIHWEDPVCVNVY